ncbi:MAG: AcaB family transcriptional regulator, partial [Candidatus Thiodiazotropha endolucinida]
MTGSETVKRDLPNDADPAVDYTTATARPGTLRGDASIVIQTRQAQKLVYGRRKTEDKAHITGLVRFGMNMNRQPDARYFTIKST